MNERAPQGPTNEWAQHAQINERAQQGPNGANRARCPAMVLPTSHMIINKTHRGCLSNSVFSVLAHPASYPASELVSQSM